VFAVTADGSTIVGCAAHAVTFTQRVKVAADAGARSISCMTVVRNPEQQEQQQHEAILLCGLDDGSIRLWCLAQQ
jgi:3-keto-L-gulonate-6-phosphate decarboxylase